MQHSLYSELHGHKLRASLISHPYRFTAAMAKAGKGKGKGKDKAKSGGLVDNRKPKHSLDVNRPSNGKGGMRDAATVSRAAMCCAALGICGGLDS